MTGEFLCEVDREAEEGRAIYYEDIWPSLDRYIVKLEELLSGLEPISEERWAMYDEEACAMHERHMAEYEDAIEVARSLFADVWDAGDAGAASSASGTKNVAAASAAGGPWDFSAPQPLIKTKKEPTGLDDSFVLLKVSLWVTGAGAMTLVFKDAEWMGSTLRISPGDAVSLGGFALGAGLLMLVVALSVLSSERR